MAIKTISQFDAATPASNDKILFEQNGEGKNATIGDIGKVIGINMDLLWTNASHTSEFASQTILLDVFKYKYFLIAVKTNIYANTRVFVNVVLKNVDNRIISTDSLGITVRPLVFVTESGIYFSDGYALNSESVDNAYAIPYQIYGVK